MATIHVAKMEISKAMEPIKAKLLIVGFETDWLFPAKRGKEIQAAAMNANILSSFVILPGIKVMIVFYFILQNTKKF